jgi:hypothetical protein
MVAEVAELAMVAEVTEVAEVAEMAMVKWIHLLRIPCSENAWFFSNRGISKENE